MLAELYTTVGAPAEAAAAAAEAAAHAAAEAAAAAAADLADTALAAYAAAQAAAAPDAATLRRARELRDRARQPLVRLKVGRSPLRRRQPSMQALTTAPSMQALTTAYRASPHRWTMGASARATRKSSGSASSGESPTRARSFSSNGPR